jgi:hypothetical protein
MLHDFRKTTNYAFVETRISIFKKMKIVDLLRKILCCYLKQKFLCNTLLKENYTHILKEKLKNFFEENSSLPYFYFLNEREILRYEGTELLERTENTLSELLTINENDSSSNTVIEDNENISNTILSDTNNINSNISLTTNNIITNRYNRYNRPTSVYRRRRSSIVLPPIVQNTYVSSLSPFEPNHQLRRSPVNSRVTTPTRTNHRTNRTRIIHNGINMTSDIRNRLSLGL